MEELRQMGQDRSKKTECRERERISFSEREGGDISFLVKI
jgi:hypothetical protein